MRDGGIAQRIAEERNDFSGRDDGTVGARRAEIAPGVGNEEGPESDGAEKANILVGVFGYIDVAGRIGCDTIGLVELGELGRAAVAIVAWGGVACDDVDRTVRIDSVDGVVAVVGEKDVACAVGGEAADGDSGNDGVNQAVGADSGDGAGPDVTDVNVAKRVGGHCVGQGKNSLEGMAAIAHDSAEATKAAAGERRDGAGRGDFAHAAAAHIRHIEIACSVEGEPGGRGELRVNGGAEVTAEAAHARACERSDDSVGIDLADNRVGSVGDVDVTGGIRSQAVDGGDLSPKSGAAVAGISQSAVAGEGCDHSVCIHLADQVVEIVGDIVIALAVHSHGDGAGELRGEGRAVVTGVAGLSG